MTSDALLFFFVAMCFLMAILGIAAVIVDRIFDGDFDGDFFDDGDYLE